MNETLTLAGSEEEAWCLLSRKTNHIKDKIHRIESKLDEDLEKYVSPKMEIMRSLTLSAAEKKSRILAIESALKHWQDCSAMKNQISEIRRISGQLKLDIETERRRLDEAKERILELSEMFDSVMNYYKQPWYKSGRINRDNYLPVVNGLAFENLSAGSGGLPTLVNGAYHLAGIIFSIVWKEAIAPKFLIVDSPRKNLGTKKGDKNANARIYDHYRMLSSTYEDNFQIIVVDNDAPSGFADFVRLKLSYDDPLIPGIEHPGEGKVKIIGGEETLDESGQLGLLD